MGGEAHFSPFPGGSDSTLLETRRFAMTDSPLIRCHGLRRVYREGGRDRVVLDDVEAELAAGQAVALLGRSGSGKSTLLNLIAGIDRADAGEVIVHGTSLGALSERERTLFRRRHIGFVYQFFNLIPTLTAAENVRLPAELNGRGAAAAAAAAARMLEAVGLGDRGDAFPERLSGGEQQRVAIARALVHDPALVLADEPTGNLDAETGRQVTELLRRMVREAGRTLVVVTHSPEVAAVADKVWTLEDGRLR